MEDHLIPIQNKLVGLPHWWFDALFGFVAIFGLFMWLFGKKLIRQALTVTGLLAGAAGAFALAQIHVPDWSPVWIAIVGAIAGAALSFFLYRPAMAIILAVALGLVAPWGLAMWNGIAMPSYSEPIQDASRKVKDQIQQDVETLKSGKTLDKNEWIETLGEGVRELWQVTKQWYEDIGSDNRFALGSTAAGAALIGLVVGLLIPNAAAMLVTAWVGVIMISGALLRVSLVHVQALGDYLPATPRSVLISLVVGTLLGVIIQWKMFRKRSG